MIHKNRLQIFNAFYRNITYKQKPRENFHNLDEVLKEQEDEEKNLVIQNKLKKLWDKKKLFGEPKDLPDFISYLAKHQIKFLYQIDPQSYTFEYLVKNFPLFGGYNQLKKLIVSKYQLRSLSEIKSHDKNVVENWKKLIDGEFDMWPTFTLSSNLTNPLLKIQALNGLNTLPCPPLRNIINPQKNYIEHLSNPIKSNTRKELKSTLKLHSDTSFLALIPSAEVQRYVEDKKQKEFSFEIFELAMQKHITTLTNQIEKLWINAANNHLENHINP